MKRIYKYGLSLLLTTSMTLAISLSTTKTLYTSLDDVSVNINGKLSGNQDWVGIYKHGTSNSWNNVIAWSWVNGKKSNLAIDTIKNNVGLAQGGHYEARLFFNNSYDVEATDGFNITDKDIGTINTLKTTYTENETVSVNVNMELTGDQDWIGVYPKGSDNSWGNVIAWNWVGEGNTVLNQNQKPMPVGEYEIRLFFHNSFDMEEKFRFNVELDKPDDHSMLKITEQQHQIIDQIVSIFENNTSEIQYGYAEHNETDQHGITAGRAGFTSATGDMLMVVERYMDAKPDNNPLAQYITELKRLDAIYANNNYELSSEGANVENLVGLIDAWSLSAKDPVFRKIQDDIVDELYFNPALKEARKIGARLPITLLNIYDASIQHGLDGVKDIINQISLAQPKDGGDEIAWLKDFNDKRLYVMLNTEVAGKKIWDKTIYRQHELVDMIEDENYNLQPFTMIIEDWGDESFSLPQEEVLTRWYQPKLNSSWHIQLSGKIDTNHHVDIYDIDLFDSSKKLIDALHKKGKKVICYFSAGSYENWREDKDEFPENTLGKKLNGWAGERWLDIRNVNLRKIMSNRIALAKEKGCDGIDPDNVDGYTNNTGFQLTSENQLDYNIFLANEAHKLGLSVGLKNDIDQINSLVNYFDFAVNEECHVYNECRTLLPFLDHSKPVLNIEYAESLSDAKEKSDDICRNNSIQKMKTLILNLELNNKFSVSCHQ